MPDFSWAHSILRSVSNFGSGWKLQGALAIVLGIMFAYYTGKIMWSVMSG